MENKSVITFPELGKFGRIGNQFWQVAACIAMANRHNADVIMKEWYCHYTKKDMLPYFKNPITTGDYASYGNSPVNPGFNLYKEPHFYYNDILFKGNTFLHGYFQSEKYFKDAENLIKFHFEPSRSVEIKMKSKYANAYKLNTCSIHVRRGDYVGNDIHDVCDMNYYRSAIELVKAKAKIDNFLVFSDDIDWCKENFKFANCKFIFVEGNDDIEDLFAMSFCDHNIICNSSFSWWAAYLNKNRMKIVISPSKWFNNGYENDKDIFTDYMIKIDVYKIDPSTTANMEGLAATINMDELGFNEPFDRRMNNVVKFDSSKKFMPYEYQEQKEEVEDDNNPHNLPISMTGAWEHTDTSEHVFDNKVAFSITNVMHDMGIRSCVDFGCGTGAYVDYLNTNNIPSVGYDGNPFTGELTAGKCKVLDLSKPFNLGITYDCVLSLEVGEHIPKLYEHNYINNLVMHCKKLIILSWGIPGQRGLGHVNCQDNQYIKEQFAKHGFKSRSYLDNILRKLTNESWFENTIMVFERNA